MRTRLPPRLTRATWRTVCSSSVAGILLGNRKSCPHTACGLAVQLASQLAAGSAWAGPLRANASTVLAARVGNRFMESTSWWECTHDVFKPIYVLDCLI